MLVSSGASCSHDFFFFVFFLSFFFTTTIHCQAVIMILITLWSLGDVRHVQATELRPCFKYVSATVRLEL